MWDEVGGGVVGWHPLDNACAAVFQWMWRFGGGGGGRKPSSCGRCATGL